YGDHRDLHSFPTRRSSDLAMARAFLYQCPHGRGEIQAGVSEMVRAAKPGGGCAAARAEQAVLEDAGQLVEVQVCHEKAVVELVGERLADSAQAAVAHGA